MTIRSNILIAAVIIFAFVGCKKTPVEVAVTEKITVSVPVSQDDIITDSATYSASWKTSFEDDHLALYRFDILVPDSMITEGSMAELRNNTNDFLSTFEILNLDSLYTEEDNHLKADLSFDYMSGDEKYRFFARFIVKDTSFVAICYITPFPVDGFSIKRKERIFGSISVK